MSLITTSLHSRRNKHRRKFLLDSLPRLPLMAYSVRRLTQRYGGPLMRIERDSDNQQLDIGFTNTGDLDTTAISSFCSGTTGRVETWYDQSGNGHDVVGNATQSLRLPIYTGGSFVTLNHNSTRVVIGSNGTAGLSALSKANFDIGDFFDFANNNSYYCAIVCAMGTANNGDNNAIFCELSGDHQVQFKIDESNNTIRNYGGTNKSGESMTHNVGDSALYWDNHDWLVHLYNDGAAGNQYIRYGRTTWDTEPYTASDHSGQLQTLWIAGGDNDAWANGGGISEIIHWSSDSETIVSSYQDLIEDDQQAYFMDLPNPINVRTFDGNNQRLERGGGHTGLCPSGSFSLVCWARMTGESANDNILCSVWGGAKSYRWGMETGTNKMILEITDDNGTTSEIAKDDGDNYQSPSEPGWQHLAAVYDSTVPEVLFYVDGVLSSRTSDVSPNPITITSITDNSIGEAFSIGRDKSDNNDHFHGEISNFGIWHQEALSASRIYDLYANGAPKHYEFHSASTVAGCSHWYNLNESSAAAYDSIDNSEQLTQNNGVGSNTWSW